MHSKFLPNLYVIYPTGHSSNCYLFTGKKPALIDSGLRENEKNLTKSLSALNLSPKDLQQVFHTHGHIDHFECSTTFPKAELWMHKHDAEFVNKKDTQFTAAGIFETYNFPKMTNFFKPKQTISLPPYTLQVLFTPGHTAGSVCFFEEKHGLLFSGDTLFRGAVGRFDLQSGNRQQLIESLKSLHSLDFKTLLPGHGELLREKQKENIDSGILSLKSAFP